MAQKRNSAKNSQPAHAREALIEAGKRVFAKKGFEGATVRDLAEAADANISLVSYYFGGKEGLYRACLEAFAFERIEAAERILREPQSVEEFKLRLRLMAEDFIDIHMRDGETCQMIHRAIDVADPITLDLFKSVFMRVFFAMQKFMSNAQNNGLLRKDLDPEMTTIFMFGSLMHSARTNFMAKKIGRPSFDDPRYLEKWLNTWVESGCHGILERK